MPLSTVSFLILSVGNPEIINLSVFMYARMHVFVRDLFVKIR